MFRDKVCLTERIERGKDMKGDGKERVFDAMNFSAKTQEKGVTAYTLARITGMTPQHVNRLLNQLWFEGRVACRCEIYRKTFKRNWITTGRARKQNKTEPIWNINPHAIRQMELPL